MFIRTRRIVALAVLLMPLAAFAQAHALDDPIVIGNTIKIHSEILNEDRTVMVSLPNTYERDRLRCPVVYLLDAGSLFLQTVAATRFLAVRGLAPDLIVVGVKNTDRTRDFTPVPAVPDKENPTAGGADNFRGFLTTELRPYIEGRYRAEPFRILIGWSLGGLFAVHALFSEPDSFDAFITASPSLWWDNKAEAAAAAKLFESGAQPKKFLYLSHGRENNDIPESVQAFAKVLGRKAPSSLKWTLDYLPEDTHGSVPGRAITNGLRSLFAGLAFPDNTLPSAAELEKRYAAFSREFGFACRLNENMINEMGYSLLRWSPTRKAEALDMFQYAVRCYPDSGYAHDSLAEAYEDRGQLKLALEESRTACRLGEQAADPDLKTYRKRLQGLEAKAAQKGQR
jgi:predicted alpha/beta superfamily hydrolase